MKEKRNKMTSRMQSATSETNAARMMEASDSRRGGDVRRASTGRTVGAATKDNRHGLHTDHGTSRRTESRRQGSMGSESKSKEQRKNW
ncbi:MAG TPA: hypothetical protein VGM92_08605 [Candidatus Kapabacteria bacterium]